MLDRNYIINYIKEYSQLKDYVYAMWLEGADGIGKVDEYSDIDFWFDVKEDKMLLFLEECVNHIAKLGELDSRADDIRQDIAQSNIHIKGTSNYLTLDICIQSHERDRSFTCYVNNDIAEYPLVLFDKDNVITYKDDCHIDEKHIMEVFHNNCEIINQSSRVIKYIHRNQYLEAYSKYISNIANPLVVIARLIYTPRHYDYDLCHISYHLPSNVVSELETLFQISSLSDIESNLSLAKVLLCKYSEEIKRIYNF